jgi:hypothetical protein
MKSTLLILLFLFTSFYTYSQKIRRHQGKIKSVSFENITDKSKIPLDSKSFFELYFGLNENIELRTKKGMYNSINSRSLI